MNNTFIESSMPLTDFCRMPAGSTAMFLCRYDKNAEAQNRITGKFTVYKGKVTLKSYIVMDPATGYTYRLIRATVIKPAPPRKKRGRVAGTKNAPKRDK